MSCEHCTMRDIKLGAVTHTEGKKYEDPPYNSAYIEEEYEGFTLFVEKRGWGEGDDIEWACISVRFCPWCGEELRGDAE